MAATFTLFPNLVPELRDLIWRATLPNYIRPTLFFYRRGCWRPRRLTESDKGYLPDDDIDNMELRFRHDLLDNDAQFNVPIFYVNREARSIALAWVREQGIQIRSRADGQLHFVRPFDVQRDVLYVPDDRWKDFCEEASDKLAGPELMDRAATLEAEIERLAVSENLFSQDRFIWLPEATSWYDHIREVLVVVGEQPDQAQGSWGWELGGMQRVAYVWDGEDEDYVQEEDESFGEEIELQTAVVLDTAELRDELISLGIRGPEIRAVSAVKR
ncbi:hypothetical protein F5Y06DRAFT_58743 [Hypoxylon sp. FL0890]|nr:hypothetical protein F5Y06DRAFT_58743 [Hypoxylon sp. FL0890]